MNKFLRYRKEQIILFTIQEVSLYLTSLNKLRSEALAVFTIPALSTNWNRLGIMVRGSNVKLFINCEHVETLSVTRPQTIEFDPASSLYIGQGGSNFKKPWEGIIQVRCKSHYYLYSKVYVVVSIKVSPKGTFFWMCCRLSIIVRKFTPF